MSRRDVVQEGERRGEHVPDEKDNLVELNRASTVEHPPHVDPVSVSEDIKDKQEQTNSTKPSSSNRYLAVFQWILLIFCVLSNIYLLSKPEIKCECDGSSADSLVTNPSPLPTASPQVIPSLLTTSLQPSSQPITDHDPTDGPSVVSSKDPTLPTIAPSFHPTMMPTSHTTSSPSKYPTNGPSVIPSMDPTLAPSTQPTESPTINPSLHPTMMPTSRPTSSPSKYPTTTEPTMQPSAYPSESPTYFDGYFIADYKYSFRNSSHGFWVICHGQWLDITQYPMLYNEIGYQFGHTYDSGNDISYFRLPDARDRVMGVIGSAHHMNEHVGNETHELSESEVPEHYHYIASAVSASDCYEGSGSYLGHRCYGSYVDYRFEQSTIAPTMFLLMQPTEFIGNLFMYSGVMH
eukprot:438649_1